MAGRAEFGGRRTFVEDARRNGQFLRVTWHAERAQFVVSNWDGNTCVGATRVPVRDAPALVDVLVHGMADAASTAAAAPPVPRTLREHLRAWWRDRTARAAVLELRHDRTLADEHHRSA